jgi:hypothetical protein
VAYVCVSGQGGSVFIIFVAECAYVSVVLGPTFLCNFFRLECPCDFGSESLYVDYWSGTQNCKNK